MTEGPLLILAGVAIGASSGVAVHYQRKNRAHERFHLGGWLAFIINFVVVVAVGRAVNPIVQSANLSGWWFVAAVATGLVTLFAVGFVLLPTKRKLPGQAGDA